MQKKTLFIIVIILFVLVLLGGYIYLLLGSGGAVMPGTNGTEQSPGFLPLNGNGGIRTSPSPTQGGGPGDEQLPANTSKLPRLRKISSEPISGAIASSTASSTIIRYIDRGTGHILEANTLTEDQLKISNVTIPKIYESLWNSKADTFIARYSTDNKTIRSYYAKIMPLATSSTNRVHDVKGDFLLPDIQAMALSPKTDKLFYLTSSTNGAQGYLSLPDGSKSITIFTSPVKGWLTEWPEENIISITDKASNYAIGELYHFNLKTGNLSKILEGRGLTGITSHDGSQVLYSLSNDNNFTTSLYKIKENTSAAAPFKTLPEKCVWSHLRTYEIYCAVPTLTESGIYPDDWYQGAVSFVDQIWLFDTSNGEVRLLADLNKETGAIIDAINLSLDNKENVLIFTDKNTLNLWSLNIQE